MSGPRRTTPAPRPAPRRAPRRTPGARPAPRRAPDTAGDVVRWAVFSCALVPVVLLWYGTPPAGAAGTALGLAAVTTACHFLLRRSELGARLGAERGTAARGGGRHTRSSTPVD
ncbi:hypothetical protein AB0E08_19610 [Streptomyces sp. NPDC048281]|uniref:hypothetical protein n=1 Tax=Streptomyces sp. NPDC048281 TaxID=3154715 RepID=UPI003419F322